MDTLTTCNINLLEQGKTIGEKLLYYRLKNNLTQNELAKIVGLSNGSCIKDIEKNKRLPGRDISERLASYFKVGTRYFFDEYLEVTYDISEKLIKYREQNKLSVREAALRFGVSDSTLSMWENGHSYPSRNIFLKTKQLTIY